MRMATERSIFGLALHNKYILILKIKKKQKNSFLIFKIKKICKIKRTSAMLMLRARSQSYCSLLLSLLELSAT